MSIPFYTAIEASSVINFLQNDLLQIIGSKNRKIFGVSPIESASPTDLAFCTYGKSYGAKKIDESEAGIIFCVKDVLPYLNQKVSKKTLLIVDNPMLQFNRITIYITENETKNNVSFNRESKIHSSAVIGYNTSIGNSVEIGAESIIESCTVIFKKVRIQKNVKIGPNSSIGIDGLAYAKNEKGDYEKFLHLGTVIIEDNVEIGANSCIVRGTLQNTIIREGTKIGNLVNIGHNVNVGRNCFISSGAVLCGSVYVEDHCWIAPQASILNHVRIGSGATVGLGAVVTKDVDPNSVVVGNPAKPIKR